MPYQNSVRDLARGPSVAGARPVARRALRPQDRWFAYKGRPAARPAEPPKAPPPPKPAPEPAKGAPEPAAPKPQEPKKAH